MTLKIEPVVYSEQFFNNQGVHDGVRVYQLDPARLSPGECHLFFPTISCEEMAIAGALESQLYPLSTPASNKFHMHVVRLDGSETTWCHFPLEDRDVCERIARRYNMALVDREKTINYNDRVAVVFPRAYNVLNFNGNRCHDSEMLDAQFKEAQAHGDRIREAMARLSLD